MVYILLNNINTPPIKGGVYFTAARLPFKIYITTNFTKSGSEPDPYWTPSSTDIPSGNYRFAIIFFHLHICFLGTDTISTLYAGDYEIGTNYTSHDTRWDGANRSNTPVTNTTPIERGNSDWAYTHYTSTVPLVGIYFV